MARAAAAARGGPEGRERYVPPATTHELSTADLDFTRDALLRFPTLYAAGDLSLLKEPAVAVVGSREASAKGRARAADLARELVRVHVVVMSGLAAGIDAAAHRSAIEHGGRTVAVTAMPLDRVYPAENASLQMEIYRRHLLLTPFKIGQRIFPKDFPERNRVMARLARATIVVEAGDTSGTLHQVVESIDAQHPVFIPSDVFDSSSITWPARFRGKPFVHPFETIDEVLDRVIG